MSLEELQAQGLGMGPKGEDSFEGDTKEFRSGIEKIK